MLSYLFSICLFWGLNLITKPLFKAIKNSQRFTVDGDSELRRQKIIVSMKLAISFGIIMAIVSLGQSAPTTEDLQKMQIGRGMEQFGYRWAKEILKKSENQNVISSGVSTGLTLAMTALGAGGKTKTEIKSALDLPESDEVIKSVMKRITEGIDKPRKVNIKIANRIFTQDGFEMNQEFKAATGDAFRAEAQNLDFSHKPDEASKTINDWVESKTNNRIKNLVSSDGVKDSSMVLVNAIYFNGKWAKPFEHSAPKLWHMDDKVSKNVSTMHLRGRFKHGALQGVDANFVILPYESDSGSEEQFYMFIIIPNEITGLKNVEDNLENVKWDASIKAGHAKKLHIDMPKFKVESTIDIKPILEKMGVNDMFSDKADFTGISKDTPLRVSKAVQKAFIDVNEEGSEAAAATAIGIAPMSLPIMPEPEIHVEIDHPFLFTIMMGKGMVQQPLFSGRIVDPKYE